jgi:hypothetical protein
MSAFKLVQRLAGATYQQPDPRMNTLDIFYSNKYSGNVKKTNRAFYSLRGLELNCS